MRLREFNAEIRDGNVLLVCCMGKRNGEQHCCGMIRIPFSPSIAGKPLARFSEMENKLYWTRVSGETVDDLTLAPSIDAGECGHFTITNGDIL